MKLLTLNNAKVKSSGLIDVRNGYGKIVLAHTLEKPFHVMQPWQLIVARNSRGKKEELLKRYQPMLERRYPEEHWGAILEAWAEKGVKFKPRPGNPSPSPWMMMVARNIVGMAARSVRSKREDELSLADRMPSNGFSILDGLQLSDKAKHHALMIIRGEELDDDEMPTQEILAELREVFSYLVEP